MQVISKSKNYDGTIMSFMEGGVARNFCIVRLACRLWRTMPGTHDAHSLLKPQQLIYMHRGEKHKNIADGRKGRVGQRLPCTTTTADQENNASGGEAASEDRPRASENQSRGLNLNLGERGDRKLFPLISQMGKCCVLKAMLCLKSEGAML